MTSILPLGVAPIKCFMFDAVPLTILATNDNYLPWLYSNYIQLCCRKDVLERKELFLQFYGPDLAVHSPFLNKQYFSWDFLYNVHIDIIKFVKNAIDNHYYYYGYLDDFYLKHRPAYGKRHFPHDIFIYGYDDIQRKFYSVGYTTNQHFEKTEISFEELESGFYSDNWNRRDYYWTDRIYLFQYNHNIEYKFDITLMKNMLQDYYSSQNTSQIYRRHFNPIDDSLFGMQVYEGIKNYYHLLLQNEMRVDFRVTSLLKEHKVCMKNRIDFLQKNKICDGLKGIEETTSLVASKSDILCSLLMKYSITKKEKLLFNSLDILEDIQTLECQYIEDLLSILENISYE